MQETVKANLGKCQPILSRGFLLYLLGKLSFCFMCGLKELLTERKLKIFGKLNTQPKVEGERFPTPESIKKKIPCLINQ